MSDSEFLRWLHDRLEFVYKENHNTDFMHRLRSIIEKIEKIEKGECNSVRVFRLSK